MPMTSAGSTPVSASSAGTASWNVRDVVLRILERPVGLERDVVVRRRQTLVDARRCGTGRWSCLPRVRPRRRRARLVPTRCRSRSRPRTSPGSRSLRVGSAWGSTTILRLRRSTSAANASRQSESGCRSPTREARSTSPLSARRIARGRSAGSIRRERSRVRPLRRAADASKLVRSPSGMPTRTTRPPGRTEAIASARAPSSPAVSNATSTPRSPGSGTSESSPGWTACVAPQATAARVRCASGSVAMTISAPAARSAWMTSRPIGPQPKTPTVVPGSTLPRSSACSATPSGSSSAASASERRSGTRCASRALQASEVRSAPSVVPWPAKTVSGQRCSIPAAHTAQRPQGTAGSSSDPLARARPGRHDARELVAEDERTLEHRVADSALDEPVPVGAAQADRRHGHKELALAGRRVRLLMEAYVVHPVEAERPQPPRPWP